MTHPLVPALVYPLYLLCRLLVHAVRDLVWWVSGVRQGSSTSPAHVLDVVARYKFDTLLQANRLEDFVLRHNSFQPVDYILKDEVSLYTVDDQRCVFVECAPGKCAWDLLRYSFSREGQYHSATRVIILPISAAHALADHLGDPSDKVVVLGNISRCGSTLLCRMFQSTGTFCSYTEPGAVSDLLAYRSEVDDQKSERMVRTTMTLLCKPKQSNSEVKGHIVKVTASATPVISAIYRTFPDFHYLFMYRNHRPVLKSLARLAPSRPYIHIQQILQAISIKLARKFTSHHNAFFYNAPWTDAEDCTSSPYTKIMTLSLSALAHYYTFLQQGMRLHAVKFEDILQDPSDSVSRVFYLCNIPAKYVMKALRPLDRDAQDKSPLTLDTIAKYGIPKMTQADEAAISEYCHRLGIPDVMSQHIHPQTVTVSGDRAVGRT